MFRLAIERLHAELQAQILLRIHHPVVTGGCDVEHQPAAVGRLDLFGVQEERLRISGGERGERQNVNSEWFLSWSVKKKKKKR